MKTKTYVLTLNVRFPKGHPRVWEETDFAEKVRDGVKIHTIRADYDLWKHRTDEVNAGRAVLSVREWLGAPRRSKQRELFRLDKDSGIGVEKLEICTSAKNWIVYNYIHIDGKATDYNFETLAANDGLSLFDWRGWFFNGKYDWTQPMAIIHFTKFRYCK